MAESTIEGLDGFTEVMDLGDQMLVVMADLAQLREQDVNARIMKPADHSQLVNNMRKRGKMESVPYCALVDGVVEIVSGHHRIRAAREAGIDASLILVDASGFKRSEIVAKQLAHNRLQGMDDPDTLQLLFDLLDTPDEILESGLSGDLMELPNVDPGPILTPSMDMNWKTVSMMFLPHQYEGFERLVDSLSGSDLSGVAHLEQYQDFMDAVLEYGRQKDIRSLGMTIALLTETALKQIEQPDAEAAE